MKKFTIFACLLLVGGLMTLNSCKKDDDSGYQPKGNYGNTDMNTTLLTNAQWGWDATQLWSYSTWNNISYLTADVVNSGSVLLYEDEGGGSYAAVPYSLNLGGGVTLNVFYTFAAGTVTVYAAASDDSNLNPTNGGTYKLVCLSKAAKIAHPNVDYKNYNEVKKAFNLKD